MRLHRRLQNSTFFAAIYAVSFTICKKERFAHGDFATLHLLFPKSSLSRSRTSADAAEVQCREIAALRAVPCLDSRTLLAAFGAEVQAVFAAAAAGPVADDSGDIDRLYLIRERYYAEVVT